MWDVANGNCVRIMTGHKVSMKLDFTPIWARTLCNMKGDFLIKAAVC